MHHMQGQAKVEELPLAAVAGGVGAAVAVIVAVVVIVVIIRRTSMNNTTTNSTTTDNRHTVMATFQDDGVPSDNDRQLRDRELCC